MKVNHVVYVVYVMAAVTFPVHAVMHERIIDDLQVGAVYVLEIYDGFRGIRGCVVGETVF